MEDDFLLRRETRRSSRFYMWAIIIILSATTVVFLSLFLVNVLKKEGILINSKQKLFTYKTSSDI